MNDFNSRASGDGFIYPVVDGGGFSTLRHRWIFERLKVLDPSPLEEALDQITKAPVGVLSSEAFHELADPALDLLVSRCGEAARETIAVVFLRRQDEYVNSFANQAWKAHRLSFAQAESHVQNLMQGPPTLFYDVLLDRLATRFNQVCPLIYEKGKSTVGQFSSVTGLRLPEAPPGKPDPNQAANAVQLATLKEVKRLAGEDPRLFDIINATREALAAPQPQQSMATSDNAPASMLNPERARSIMELYQQSNERLHARWFPDREQLFPAAQFAKPVENVKARADVVQQVRVKFKL